MGSGYNYFHISTLPRLHYIVWCRVPRTNGTIQLNSVVRPALVRGTERNPVNGRGRVLVSYGTTKLELNARRLLDLIIMNAGRLNELDLPSAVRFNLDMSNWLPWAPEFFGPPTHSQYVIAGPLTEIERARLTALSKTQRYNSGALVFSSINYTKAFPSIRRSRYRRNRLRGKRRVKQIANRPDAISNSKRHRWVLRRLS